VINLLNLKTGRAAKVALLTFTISLFISYTFQFSLVLWVSGLILLVILLTGIIFDVIGTAATAASEAPFHAMAADKVKGSKQAIYLIRHADKVASFCNDVVGDISGTVNGAIVASISFILVKMVKVHLLLPDKLIGAAAIALIAALTVGGKSLGKSYAINNANQIIFSVGKLLYFFKFNGFKSTKNKRKTGVSRKVRKG
jgi:CBS domain containing-hemolysin-like protein